GRLTMAAPAIPKVIATGIEVANRLDRLLADATYKAGEPAQYAARLCLTIGEAFSGVLALLESPAESHAPVLARTMLEALVDLKNLLGDTTYLDQMRFDNANQHL